MRDEMFRYRQSNKYESPVDPERCRASVSGDRMHIYQCQRKPMPGSDWCRQHSPAAIKARRAAGDKRYQEEVEAAAKRRKRYAVNGLSPLLCSQCVMVMEQWVSAGGSDVE